MKITFILNCTDCCLGGGGGVPTTPVTCTGGETCNIPETLTATFTFVGCTIDTCVDTLTLTTIGPPTWTWEGTTVEDCGDSSCRLCNSGNGLNITCDAVSPNCTTQQYDAVAGSNWTLSSGVDGNCATPRCTPSSFVNSVQSCCNPIQVTVEGTMDCDFSLCCGLASTDYTVVITE